MTHAVPRLDEAVALFVGLLGGLVEDRGEQPAFHWLDLRWEGPLALRLVAPRRSRVDGTSSTGSATVRDAVHHVAFVAESPERIDGAVPVPSGLAGAPTDPGSVMVGPGVNLGLRLVISPAPLR